MTSTHVAQQSVAATLPASPNVRTVSDSPSADSHFSDDYKEHTAGIDGQQNGVVSQDLASDDYAMTFDSDAGEHSDSQAITQAKVEKETKPTSIPTSALPSPSNSSGSHASGPEPSKLKPTEPESLSLLSTAVPTQVPQNIQTPVETPRTHTYQETADDGMDIQALLDNITANAEKNEAVVSLNTPKSATPTSSTFPKGLPAHSSLPPRPDIPRIGFRDDISKYHATNASHSKPIHGYMPPPGVNVPLVAAGAPGTSTDRRGGLPPPPTASFTPLDLPTSNSMSADVSQPATSPPLRHGHTQAPRDEEYPEVLLLDESHLQNNPSNLGAQSLLHKVRDHYEIVLDEELLQTHQSNDEYSYHEIQAVDENDLRILDAAMYNPHARKIINTHFAQNIKWSPEINKKYDQFLIEEQGYVKSGQWSQFPPSSRMFIGNLASDKVTKRDIYHVFYQYGRIAQIAIKQAFAFVQFHDARVCQTAVTSEQGKEIRGKAIQLEVSKPAKNSKNPNFRNTRTRSPDRYTPGGQPGGPDRRFASRQDEYGRDLPNGYPPRRSISPPRNNFRRQEENEYSRGDRNFSRDSYNGRDRDRSRSPYGRDNVRYRKRSPSPRGAPQYLDHQVSQIPQMLQAPQRDPSAIPDIEIIVLEPLDNDFVSWVVSELNSRSLKSEVMFLNPREPLDSVIQRQIIDGVHAVSMLNLRSQSLSQISLQVFKRQPGSEEVQFDEYQDLAPSIAAGVVQNVKSQLQQIYVQPQYQTQFNPPQPQFIPQQVLQAPTPAPIPDLANAIGQMDNATLQKLLGSINSNAQQNTPAVAANSSVDLAAILGQLAPKPTPQPISQQYQVSPAANSYANEYSKGAPAPAPALAQTQEAGQVQNILAQLARFRQQ